MNNKEIKCSKCIHYNICALWTTTDLDTDEAHKYCYGHFKEDTGSGWISVDERLPEVDPSKKGKYHDVPVSIRVLCACKQKSGKAMVKEGYCEFCSGGRAFWRIPGSIDAVTHWMYMPELPVMDD